MRISIVVVVALWAFLGLLVGGGITIHDQPVSWQLGLIIGFVLGGLLPIVGLMIGWLFRCIGAGEPILGLIDLFYFSRDSFRRIGREMRRIGFWAVAGSTLMIGWSFLLTTLAWLLFTKRIIVPTNRFVPVYSANWYIGGLAIITTVILMTIGTYRLLAVGCSRVAWRTAAREERIHARGQFLLLNPITLPFVIMWAILFIFWAVICLTIGLLRGTKSPP